MVLGDENVGTYDPSKEYNPYGITAGDISSGIRRNLNACQYFIKGLSGICRYWENGDPGNCTHYEEEIGPEGETKRVYPSGWNYGRCDYLGRRCSCDKYDNAGLEDLDQYVCILPNPFKSGVLRDVLSLTPPFLPTGQKIAVPKSKIQGYNEVDDGSGRCAGLCDGCGFGRGENGYDLSEEELAKRPVICSYYRPWHMGFGAIQPKTTTIVDGKYVDVEEELGERLPLSFKIYNLRAKLQKCAYWDRDSGSDFVLDAAGLYLESDDDDRSDFCTCTDARATPYHTVDEDAFDDYRGYMLIENVWSEAGCVVCNGASPGNCPCYTGKWLYCTYDKFEDGDKVSAQQIMELRFWMNDWNSQEEYDNTFKKPPNKSDPSTADIYTYYKWEQYGSSVDDSILKGKKVHMCVPTYDYEFSDDLLQVDELIYRKDKGTAVKDQQMSFPSLVRDIEAVYYKPLNIIYPYGNKDPFDVLSNPLCSDDKDKTPCIKRNWSMDENNVMVYGDTIREKSVYAFNLDDAAGNANLWMIRSYDNDFQIDVADKVEFYENMVVVIENLTRENVLYKSQSDENGIFYVGPVPLTYQKLNTIVICVDFGDGTWAFRKRDVWSQWHGGVLKQCNSSDPASPSSDSSTFAFSHEYGEGQYVTTEKQHGFGPSATANGISIALNGVSPYGLSTSLNNLLPVYGDLIKSLWSGDRYSYSYCIKIITLEDEETRRWRGVSTAGHIWVDIADTNLNYIFGSDVESAKMVIENDEGEEETVVELERVYPNNTINRIDIPPNVFVLKPKDSNYKNKFFKSDGWILKITYWYKTISTNEIVGDNEEVFWPSGGIQEAPYSVSYEAGDTNITPFSVSDIVLGTAAVMGLFIDEDGRLISTFATKMCVNIVGVLCRDVEIRYKWGQDAPKYKLMPDRHWPTELAPAEYVEDDYHESDPPCGDHDMSFFKGTGPLWYPYEGCDIINFYSVWTGSNFCTMPHEGVPRADYRMCGPETYRPYCGSNPSSGQTCANDYIFFYSEVFVDPLFKGWVRKRKQVNVSWYQAMEWALPKFGNVSREYVERYMSMDSINYLSLKTGYPMVKRAWMPMVIDSSNFYFSFNCFDQTSYIDIFSHVNQLNFMLCGDVSEEIKEERKSFDEVFSIRQMILASYPGPMIDDGGFYNKVNFYYFNNEKYMYAWQEKWKDIERAAYSSTKLDFIAGLDKPDYVYDMYKKEFRFVPEEGTYMLYYKAPEIDKENGAIIKFPSLQLGAGPERWFGILYTGGSDEDEVVWVDENFGMVDGSGGGGEKNVYQETSDRNKWVHTDYTLFDYDFARTYDEAKVKDREITISYNEVNEELEKRVYNTGIELSIPRSRLKYLPYEEGEVSLSDFVFDVDSEGSSYIFEMINIPGKYKWHSSEALTTNTIITLENYECISKVEIRGVKGVLSVYDGDFYFCTPGITISSSSSTEGDDWEELYTSSYEELNSEEIKDKIFDGYFIEAKFDITPQRMIKEASKRLKITVSGPANYGVSITSIFVHKADYVDAEEIITIWERKYYVSEGKESVIGTFNPNGPQRPIMFDWNFDNSGVYFLASGAHTNRCTGVDKMRSVHADREWFTDEDVPVVTVEQLQTKEQTAQMDTYNSAYEQENALGDERTFAGVWPKRVEEFFDEVGVSFPISRYGSTIRSEKISWHKHYLVGGYTPYALWQPGGHYFVWKDEVEKLRCYWPISPLYDIHRVKFVHAHPPGGYWTEDQTQPLVSMYYLRKAYYVGVGIQAQLLGRSAIARTSDVINLTGLY